MWGEITYAFPNFNGEILGLYSIKHDLIAFVSLFQQQ